MATNQNVAHDQYLSSLAALPPQTLSTVDDAGVVKDLVVVKLEDLLPRVAPSATDLRGDLDRVVPEIVHWGRLVAIQKRVWTQREREYRTWKAQQELDTRRAAEEAGKKVTEAAVEAAYRTAPQYGVVSARVERAEEAFMFADAVYRAFKAKQEVLLADVRHVQDGSLQRIS